ncbi:MAG: Nif3-like dinuclear metal center hexameric protein [Bacteroidales bacterium]|nr:Nif3-like dinuclear metal center hexameric protein [Bacteroidales bacterium]
MKVSEISRALEEIAPLNLQEPYDNSGLLIGESDREVRKALITLDLTEEVMEEAVREECGLIIAHHPMIFKGIKRITGANLTERLIVQAIQNNIAVYAIHTNLDNAAQGVNKMLAEKLGLQNTRVLQQAKSALRKLVVFCPVAHLAPVRSAMFAAGAGQIGNYSDCSFNISGTGSFKALAGSDPFVGEQGKLHEEDEIRIETVVPDYRLPGVVGAMIAAHPYEEVAYDVYPLSNSDPTSGAGMIGEVKNNQNATDFLTRVKQVLGTPFLRHSPLINQKVKKIAICGGSGSFLIHVAARAGADIFLSADIKYHDFFEYRGKMTIVDAGHFETEQFTKELLFDILKEKFPNFALRISGVDTNPVSFL